MSQTRFNRIVIYATTGIVLLLALAGLFIAIERRQTQAETGAVLSALFTQQILHDANESGPGRKIEIVIQRKPDCRMCSTDGAVDMGTWFSHSLKSRARSLSDAWFAQSSRITRVSFFFNSLFSDDMSADLTLPEGNAAVFVDTSDIENRTDFEARFPNNFGFFVVSHIGMNLTKTEALLYMEHFCGGLCGSGDYFLMRKINGTWRVFERHGVWVS
jgi:hypothetical protein